MFSMYYDVYPPSLKLRWASRCFCGGYGGQVSVLAEASTFGRLWRTGRRVSLAQRRCLSPRTPVSGPTACNSRKNFWQRSQKTLSCTSTLHRAHRSVPLRMSCKYPTRSRLLELRQLHQQHLANYIGKRCHSVRSPTLHLPLQAHKIVIRQRDMDLPCSRKRVHIVAVSKINPCQP